MPKITEINFKNYRAFWGEDNALKIDGKNALIYGENGSGKSSLYQGLKEFFRASDVNWTIEQPPTHLKADNPNDYEVKVVFDKNFEHPIIFNGQTIEEEKTAQTFLLNSFLSYKEMLRTHFLEQHEFGEKFFKLLTETLLVEHELGDTTIGKALKDLQEKLSNSTDKTKLLEKIRKTIPDADEEDLDEISPGSEIDAFKSLFDEKLEEISIQLNKILGYFKQSITVKFENVELNFDEKEKELKGQLGLDIKYIDIDRINHLEILNEARLSALAISIYLAAIVTNPIAQKAQKAKYKILFLDDVFIGLDTSNRLPLLEILQKFSAKRTKPFFKDFQIFITTYDRYWFEIAKKSLIDSWTTVEMFVGEARITAEQKICEKPVIVQENLGNLEKAKRYFDAFDYFSAGNWLRKALEEELERLVPQTYRIEVNKLESLIDKLFVYYTDLSCIDLIPTELKIELKTFKDSVLNPSSHFNLQSPIYKAEIEETFRVIDKLKELPIIERKLLIGMRSAIFYRNDEKDYDAEYILRENIYAVKIEGSPTRISDANHSTVFWRLGKVDFSKKNGTAFSDEEIVKIKSKVIKLSEKSERISDFLDLPEPPDWKEFTNVEGKTLIQLSEEDNFKVK